METSAGGKSCTDDPTNIKVSSFGKYPPNAGHFSLTENDIHLHKAEEMQRFQML